MITTKEQERKALEKIKKIVEELGENSYVGAAFDGCFDWAEDNIEYDAAFNMKESFEYASEQVSNLKRKIREKVNIIEQLKKQLEQLKKQLEIEQEWKPYEDDNNVSQKEYEHLTAQRDTKFLSDEEAKDLLYKWYGFAKEKVTIYHSVPRYEINRHNTLRRVGEVERKPAYNSTDWNYIRFNCGAMSYELYNDKLNFF